MDRNIKPNTCESITLDSRRCMVSSGAPSSFIRDHSMDSSSTMSNGFEPPKKKRVRARLDHLTPSEKLQRRKMKNRVAAQTARDRKRAKIDQLEAENQKLREENDLLKSRLSSATSNLGQISLEITDSGISDVETSSKKSTTTAPMSDNYELLAVPSSQNPTSPSTSLTSGFCSVPTSDENEYFDSFIGENNEKALIDDIIQLQNSIFSDQGNDSSIETAELINAPPQQVQEASSQSLSVENSAGWTAIQLMLLLMISKVHRQYYSKTRCCAMQLKVRIGSAGEEIRSKVYANLYDYIQHIKCPNFREAVSAVIMNKNDIRRQRLATMDFVYKYLSSSQLNQHKANESCSSGNIWIK